MVLKDPHTGQTIEGGDIEGEICLRGDVVTPGYYKDPERTAAAFDEEGFLHTRDLGYRDAAGWYYIRGRTDDIIKCGAEKLSLLEIDACWATIRACVTRRAWASRTSASAKCLPPSWCCARPRTRRPLRPVLDDYCIGVMERWKRPRLYVFVDSIPRTAAKQTKMQGAMKSQIAGIKVMNADGVTTLGALKAKAPA